MDAAMRGDCSSTDGAPPRTIQDTLAALAVIVARAGRDQLRAVKARP